MTTHLTPRHAMEEKLLGLDARHESPVDETARSGCELESGETRQALAGDHNGRSLALQLDLAEEAGNLHGVNGGTFSPRLNHELKVVFREFANQTGWETSPRRKK